MKRFANFIIFIALAGALPAALADNEFYVVTLGTGIPLPNADRAAASNLIVAGDATVLVDAGPGCNTRLAAAGQRDISLALFTHFHWDHIAGFGEVMFGRGAAGVDVPLPVMGPVETKEAVDAILAGYAKDTDYRIAHHGEHWPADAMKVEVSEKAPGEIYNQDGLKITMFNVDHSPVVPAVGYRFDYGGKSIVISGDTKKIDAMVEQARDCDILVHEAVNANVMKPLQIGLQRTNPRRAAIMADMMKHHTTTIETAEIARDAGVKKLVLTHLVPSIPPTDTAETSFVAGMQAIYDGPIIVARDGTKITP